MRSRRWHRSWVGRDFARGHIAAAGAFFAEVNGMGGTAKETFFRLSGTALDAFVTGDARSFDGAAPALRAPGATQMAQRRRHDVRGSHSGPAAARLEHRRKDVTLADIERAVRVGAF